MKFILMCMMVLYIGAVALLFSCASTPVSEPDPQTQAKVTEISKNRSLSVFLIEYENKKFLATYHGIVQIQE